jgi:Ca-activated chloride channel family protein
MKKLFFLMLAGVLARQVVAASEPDVTLRVAPERDLVYSAGPREVIVQVEIEARKPDHRGHRVPMNLALVLDRSGSMQGAKIEKARQAACVAVDQLADDDLLSVVIYDNDAEVLLPPEPVGNSRHREELKSAIDRIRPRGSTALHAGVSAGARLIRKNLDKERVNRVILLSDGLANVGPSRPADLAALGRELRGEGIAVTTIGLGDDYNEDLMTALAEASSANYYYVKDAEKLPGIFAEELGVARSLIARGITIQIRVPDGVRLREIIGRPEIECRGRSAEIRLDEIFGSEKRRFLARCVVEEKRGEPLDVAAIEMSYETTAGTRAPAQAQMANVKFTDEAPKSDASLRPAVAQEVSVAKNRVAKELAVKLADEGRAKEAVAVLRQQAVANAAAPAAAQLPALPEENRKLEAAASELDRGGQLEKSSRKAIQYDNYKDKYQKN